MTAGYTAADLRRQAEAVTLLKQMDTAAMLRQGAMAMDELSHLQVTLRALLAVLESPPRRVLP
jgi:hypothetical protein